jgi:ribosome maturation factor RimP
LGPVERVREVAVRVAASYGLDIFDVELRRESGQQVLRVVLDRPGPNATAEESVSLEDCARVSEEISTILDVEDVALADRYTLEVSSPGLDRPLRHAEDYRRFAGRRAKIVMSQPVARQTAFAGRLQGLDGDDVMFESEGGKLVRLPLKQISRARLDVEF